MHEISYRSDERLSAAEYVAFLRTSNLGTMYPMKDFQKRIERLLSSAGVTVTARHGETLVGVCLGITDHAYFLFITDLGVSRDYEGRGIGRSLVLKAHEAIGGGEDITVVAWANRAAMRLYAACGLVPQEGLVGKEGSDWEPFDVGELNGCADDDAG